MARIRTIKPEFWTHEDLSALPEATHMLAAALLNHADDEGYFNANPGLVKAACCPLREPSVSPHDSLNLLAKVGFICLGTGADGKRYGRVMKFDDHQRVNRPTPSKIKAVGVVWDSSVSTHAQLTEPSPPERNREQGKEQGREGNRDSSLRSDSSAPSAADPSAPPAEQPAAESKPKLELAPPADLGERKAERLRQVTADAIDAFNATLGKPHGLLPAVSPKVGREKRQDQVKRCLRVARQICEQQFGALTITREFWDAYFAECERDDFKSGRKPPGREHSSWTPTFEYLTREDVVLGVFDKATSEHAA